MSRRPQQPETDHVTTYAVRETLEDVLTDVRCAIPDGLRPYRVVANGESQYVLAKSPGQAAQAVCDPAACSTKDIMAAMAGVARRQLDKAE